MALSQHPGPILKWPGGKRQLLAQLRRFYPPEVGGYLEPFLGSGAVFFDLFNRGALGAAPVLLSDRNADLIGTYRRVCDATGAVIGALTVLDEGHARDPRAHYYRVRDDAFNPQREVWRQRGGDPGDFSADLAAMFVYLNRTGYNGLFRLNASGRFNVPAGRYGRPRIVIADRLHAAAAPLSRPQLRLQSVAFDEALAAARPGDLVYLDPPYAPLTATANFRAYTAAGFSADDQVRLRDLVLALAARRVDVILSNSTAPSVMALYDTRAARSVGLRCFRVPARRAINTRGDRRGAIEELIVSNRRPREA